MINNYRDRRKEVDGILIHSMGEFIGDKFAYDFLKDNNLSAHFLIDAAGNIIHGPDTSKVAFHAGLSEWKGQTNLNETFIGIEFLIFGFHNWSSFVKAIADPTSFTEDHYKSCAKICRDLMKVYPLITKDRILGHSEVSGKDVRSDPKIDPGVGFSMSKLKELI